MTDDRSSSAMSLKFDESDEAEVLNEDYLTKINKGWDRTD